MIPALVWSFTILLIGGPPISSRAYPEMALCRDARERVTHSFELVARTVAKETGRPFLVTVGECRPVARPEE